MNEAKNLKETEIVDKVINTAKKNKEKIVVFTAIGICVLAVIIAIVIIFAGSSFLTIEEEINLINNVEFDTGEQFEDGLLLDMQEIEIAYMQERRMKGAEVVLRIMEQYVDSSYKFAFISDNYRLPLRDDLTVAANRETFVVALAGYVLLNHLIYCQVFYDKQFFFVMLAKEEADVLDNFQVPLLKMNYDKFNSLRRNNVRDTIQRNNIVKIGIEDN